MEFFEISGWIENHKAKYDLSNSGMGIWNDFKKYSENFTLKSENDVKEDIATLYSVDKENISLTHGATEAYSIFILINRKELKCRYIFPEYELIFKTSRIYDVGDGNDILCISNPHNPTGEFLDIKSKSIIDETFLLFYMDPDKVKYEKAMARINTFTKFFHDEVRAGWIISDYTQKIEGLRGLIFERVSSVNLGIAHAMLKDFDKIKENIRGISEDNLKYIRKNMGKLKFYNNSNPVNGTVVFLDYSYYTNLNSFEIANMLYENNISVVPSKFFGVEGPYIRVAYTSKNFTEGFNELMKFFEKFL